MELTVMDRLMLLQVLPKEGDFLSLRILRELKEELSFTEEEQAALELKQNREAGTVNWNLESERAQGPKDVPIVEKATDLIVEALKGLNSRKQLTEAHMPIYERFVEV